VKSSQYGVSPALQRAWNIDRDQKRPGPKASLTLDSLLETGIELGNAEGVVAISLGRIAAQLGVTTNALYRYVGSRDELHSLIRDRAIGVPDYQRTDERWQDGIKNWAHSLRAKHVEHPWLADLAVAVPLMPNALSWLEWLLRQLEAANLQPSDQVRVAAHLDGFVRANAIATRDTMRQGTEWTKDVGALIPALEQHDLTRVVALFRSASYTPTQGDPGAEDFEFGLDCIIAGLEQITKTL
jgi:AcrR family transcriptional regulator